MYLVQDSADVVVAWLPTGTEIMYWATEQGIDTVDWHLDLLIDSGMVTTWKDEEEEATAALGTPHLLDEDLLQARQTGERIAADPVAWLRVVGDWRSFTPPENWESLTLPEDWDVAK